MKEKNNLRGNRSLNDKIPKARSEHAGKLIKVVDYDPAKHLVKVVGYRDNEPLDKDQALEEKIMQKKAFDHPRAKSLKTLDLPSAPIIEVNDEVASLRGNSDYGFFSYRDGGANIIKGPLSIAAEPHQIRIAGLTTLNPLITSGFASTIVTPLPATVWAIPTTAMIKPILKNVLIAGTILAAAGSAV